MSLDKNLFTLIVTPNKDDPNVVDLVDPAGTIHYRKQRVPDAGYKVEVYDPMSESLLVTATAPSSTSKIKVLELCNPTMMVELKYTGTLSFKWSFKWEEHEFEWKREECFMLRKPDPPVLVAVTKEPAGRLKTSSIQILDYNLNRFDIEDRKGLEIVMLTALLTFHDANDTYHASKEGGESSPMVSLLGVRRTTSDGTSTSAGPSTPPVPPPKPAPKTGVDRIAEIQAIKGEYNEVTVEEEGTIEDYGEYCFRLLQDDAILFITIRSAGAEQVPKVVQVVEQTKRVRHKAGIEDEIYQYVLYDTIKTPQKGPRRINLDDDDKGKANKYTPPNSLTIHISKIPMPELQPKAAVPEKSAKELKKEEKDKEKKDKEKEKREKKDKDKKDKEKKEERKAKTPPPTPGSGEPSSSSPPRPNKLTRPGRSSSPSSRVHAHQTHPNQPSPSPSQLNNPSIYAAPPPHKPTPSPAPPMNWHGPPSGQGGGSYAQSFYGSYIPPPPRPPQSGYYPPHGPPSSQGWQGHPPPPPPPHHNQHSQPPNPSPATGSLTPSNVVAGLLGMLNRR